MPTPTVSLEAAEAAYLADHRSRNSSPKTIEHYAETFRDFGRFLAATGRDPSLDALTTATFQAFRAWLVETPLRRCWRGSTVRSARSIQGRLKDLRAFTAWLAEGGQLQQAPKVPLPKVPQRLFPVFTDAELVTLFSCPHLTATGAQGVRNRALVALLLDTGIRLAELVALQPADLLLDNGLVRVIGKGDKARMVPISSAVVDRLKEWLAVRGAEPGRLFWLTRDGVKMLLRRIQRETGLHLHAHKLRHTAATKLVRSGLDLHTVRRILGHNQLSTVEIYLSLSNEDLRVKHNAASPFESIRQQLPQEETRTRKRHRLPL